MPMYSYEHDCPDYLGAGETRVKESRLVPVAERDAQTCDVCNGRLARVPVVANFSIQGFSAKNGYSK